MSLRFTEKSASVAQACDGAVGWYDGTYDYILGGWLGGTTTLAKFWRSANGGASFSAQSDFSYPFHTAANCVVNNVLYLVGGDIYSPQPANSNDYVRSSMKFEAGSWSTIAADCDMADRCLSALVFLDDAFYLIGGQATTDKTGTVYNTVLRSDDGCANFTSILADTKAQGFGSGQVYGACVAWRGLLWMICGGVYDNDVVKREPDRHIFSSPDGITWTYRADFAGVGRGYPECIVYNDRLYVIGGYNGMYGANLQGVWTIDLLADGRFIQEFHLPTFSDRHAHSAWVSSAGILVFGGTSNAGLKSDCWLIEEL